MTGVFLKAKWKEAGLSDESHEKSILPMAVEQKL